MEKILTDELWISFIETAHKTNTFSNYENYYKSLVSWLKSHKETIGDDFIERYELDTILYITPKDYVLESSEYHGISLLMEKDRMFGRKPETLESLLMRIRDTLWDLITISSKKDCPVCEGELRYFLAKQENHIEKIVLECASCTWTENLDGSEWKEGIIQFYPINKAELLKNGVQI